MTDYEVTVFYTQSEATFNHSSDKEYYGTKLTFKTCFGEPWNVLNLQVEEDSDGLLTINWDRPKHFSAPNVCYYEVTVTETAFPSNLF